MYCKRCQTNNAMIQQAPDNYSRDVKCLFCGYTEPLKYYNKKQKQKNYANLKTNNQNP
jgi:Zn ribbon nucleic-acid-binding protein